VKYLIDSDVFIQAKNRHYGFAVCPGVWVWIERAHSAGDVCCAARVGKELREGNDRLAEWAKTQSTLFVPTNEPTVAALREVSTWANESHYEPPAVAEFLGAADSELVAFAKAHELTVVAHEVASNGKKIKIPNACKQFGVAYCDPFAMLDAEGARFVLDR